MPSYVHNLHQLGWRPLFSRQLSLDDLDTGFPARVAVVQRTLLTVLAESGEHHVTLPPELRPGEHAPAITVGDWVLVHRQTLLATRLLERQSLVARVAAGSEGRPQSIAANIDTLLVTMSCNADFNLSRLERYLAMAFEARVTPVVVLTKADLCADPLALVELAQEVAPGLAVVALNAMDAGNTILSLRPWLDAGQTIACVGSSGVGKSTLVNSLLGVDIQSTAGIREADSKGRHTTTARQLFSTPGGAWLIDTPGMRELNIGAAEAGLARAFDDIETLARQCRFRDCSHNQDQGCALHAAVANGLLDARRLENYLKLQREAARAVQTPWERHGQQRQFGRVARATQKLRRKDTRRD